VKSFILFTNYFLVIYYRILFEGNTAKDRSCRALAIYHHYNHTASSRRLDGLPLPTATAAGTATPTTTHLISLRNNARIKVL
jgi:hypothetical protein